MARTGAPPALPTTTTTIPVYGAPSSAPAGGSPAATSSAQSGGSFPQGQSATSSPAEQIVAGFNSQGTQGITQFFAYYDITSSETQAMYENIGKSGTATLNQNAVDLVEFYTQDEASRQETQDQLVAAGLLNPTDANGMLNSSSITAFKQAITSAAPTGLDTFSWLAQNGTGTSAIQNQVSADLTQAEQNAVKPISASITPSAEDAAFLQNAFAQALGFSPTQDEINGFVKQITGQELSAAEAPRQEAQAELQQAKSQESALSKLGPDGIDLFVQAYGQAIHAGGAQGPITGQQSLPGAAGRGTVPTEQIRTPGTPPQTRTTSSTHQAGLGNVVLHNLNPLNWGIGVGPSWLRGDFEHYPDEVTSTTTRTIPGTGGHTTIQQPLSANAAYSATPGFHGGIYALPPAMWKQARALTPSAQKYATAGQAPVSVQQAAFTNLASALYDQSGSWADVAIELGGGTPSNAKGKTASSTQTTETFAENLANHVNAQITNLQNQVNSSVVTAKSPALDETGIEAEAAQAAKDADPVGYYAANFASWGSLLTKMLYGTPLTEMASTTDSFNGPVGATTAESNPVPVQSQAASAGAASPRAPSSSPPAQSSASPAPSASATISQEA